MDRVANVAKPDLQGYAVYKANSFAALPTCRPHLEQLNSNTYEANNMKFTTFLALAFAALVNAVNANYSWCTKNPYSVILPYSKYGPAQSYCTSHYPLQTGGGTTTVTKTVGGHHTTWVTKTTGHTVTATKTTKKANRLARRTSVNSASGWASCSSKLQSDGGFRSACSCIETTPTKPAVNISTMPCYR